LIKKKIVLTGIGGQGIILASTILGHALTREGYDVRISEVHGMAQRGGEVRSTIAIGYHGAIAGRGEADVILGFEPSETYKVVHLASKDSWIITNTHRIVPTTVSLGKSEYPPTEEILAAIREVNSNLIALDANRMAREAGNEITANVVMLGALSAIEVLPITREAILEETKNRVPPKAVEVNLRSFEAGYGYIKNELGKR